MKKYFILALAGSLVFGVVSAQTHPDYRSRRSGHERTYSKEDQFRRNIARINSDYDRQIAYVRSNPHMSNKEKRRTIKSLEKERNFTIAKARDNYSRRYSDRVAQRDRHYNTY